MYACKLARRLPKHARHGPEWAGEESIALAPRGPHDAGRRLFARSRPLSLPLQRRPASPGHLHSGSQPGEPPNTHRHAHTYTHIQANKPTDGRSDRQADGQTDRQISRRRRPDDTLGSRPRSGTLRHSLHRSIYLALSPDLILVLDTRHSTLARSHVRASLSVDARPPADPQHWPQLAGRRRQLAIGGRRTDAADKLGERPRRTQTDRQ
jgi:hypothetical protein